MGAELFFCNPGDIDFRQERETHVAGALRQRMHFVEVGEGTLELGLRIRAIGHGGQECARYGVDDRARHGGPDRPARWAGFARRAVRVNRVEGYICI